MSQLLAARRPTPSASKGIVPAGGGSENADPVAPKLFVMMADFYGIKLPSRRKKVLTGTDAEGKAP